MSMVRHNIPSYYNISQQQQRQQQLLRKGSLLWLLFVIVCVMGSSSSTSNSGSNHKLIASVTNKRRGWFSASTHDKKSPDVQDSAIITNTTNDEFPGNERKKRKGNQGRGVQKMVYPYYDVYFRTNQNSTSTSTKSKPSRKQKQRNKKQKQKLNATPESKTNDTIKDTNKNIKNNDTDNFQDKNVTIANTTEVETIVEEAPTGENIQGNANQGNVSSYPPSIIFVPPPQSTSPSGGRQMPPASSLTTEDAMSRLLLRSILMNKSNGANHFPNKHHHSMTAVDMTTIISSFLSLIIRLSAMTWLTRSRQNHVYTPKISQHFMLENLNDRYVIDSLAMRQALKLQPRSFSNKRLWNLILSRRGRLLNKSLVLSNNKKGKTNKRDLYSKTVIVMDIKCGGEGVSSTVEYLRDAVTYLLSQHRNMNRLIMGHQLEVVILLQSPGGSVTQYGLAADQIARLRSSSSIKNGDDKDEMNDKDDTSNNDSFKDEIKVTVCVDKVAASGGYMMASQASKGQLIAAPFAVVGSIGVFMESLNVYEVLKKYGVQSNILKAGDAKMPLSTTGKITKQGLDSVQENLDETHNAFQQLIHRSPRSLVVDGNSVDKITNGQVFFGQTALQHGLIDKIQTSDDYIFQCVQNGDRVLKLHKYDKSKAGGFRRNLSPLDLLLSSFQTKFGQEETVLSHLITNIISLMKTGGIFAFWNLLLRTQKLTSRQTRDYGYNNIEASYDDDLS